MTDKTDVSGFDSLLPNALADIASTLKQAVTAYGPEVVDLTLLAYRVEAMTQLAYGVASILMLPLIIWAARHLIRLTQEGWEDSDDGAQMARVLGLIVLAAFGLGFVLGGLDSLLSVMLWAAAFGWPELMIATKALQAAGLL